MRERHALHGVGIARGKCIGYLTVQANDAGTTDQTEPRA
jgi:hypothetical protein